MATTAVVFSSTPHSVIISMTSADGMPGTITRVDLLAALAAGPLKELLTRTADWTVFNLAQAGARRIHVREVVERTATAESQASEIWWTATGMTVQAAVGAYMQFEIRLQHSERL